MPTYPTYTSIIQYNARVVKKNILKLELTRALASVPARTKQRFQIKIRTLYAEKCKVLFAFLISFVCNYNIIPGGVLNFAPFLSFFDVYKKKEESRLLFEPRSSLFFLIILDRRPKRGFNLHQTLKH